MNKFESLHVGQGIWTRRLESFADHRGRFSEISRFPDLEHFNIKLNQCSYSYSSKDVVRGLHSQSDQWQLITLVHGSITQFLLDTNLHAEDLRRRAILELQVDKMNQVLIAPGVFHGYHVKSEDSIIVYHTSTIYAQELEHRKSLIRTFEDMYRFPDGVIMSKLDIEASWSDE